jgi:hypothetical protein
MVTKDLDHSGIMPSGKKPRPADVLCENEKNIELIVKEGEECML